MIKQERIKLESLGVLSECGIQGESLNDLANTGQELREFLDGYVADHPDSEGWPQWQNRKINHLLFAILSHQTQDHCSFCDGHPMTDDMSAETIEHFRPKAGVHSQPKLRLTWENLFACCSGCQQAKGQKWDDRLLKPDADDYSFDRYFSCEFTTGKIVPKRRQTTENRKKAEVTIEMYDLNRSAGQRQDMVTFDPYYNEKLPPAKRKFRFWVEALERARKQID